MWLHGNGVPTESTGSGYLRGDVKVPDAHILREFDILNTAVWNSKLLWLDLLSLTSADHWYPVQMIAELLQLCSASALFEQLFTTLQEPQAQIYLPVYRASFLGDTTTTVGFETWVRELLERFLKFTPAVTLSEDKTSVRFEPNALRIYSPAGLSAKEREVRLQQIFRDQNFVFETPSFGPTLKVLPKQSIDSISTDATIDTILDWLGNRKIKSFNGRKLTAVTTS